MEQNNAFLGSAPIGKLMRGYALPCIISCLLYTSDAATKQVV